VDTSTLVYDGDCGFCFASVKLLRSGGYKGTVVEYQNYLDELGKYSLSTQEAQQGSILIDEIGKAFFGVDAILEGMSRSHSILKFVAVVLKFYPFKRFSHGIYSWIATNRMFLSAFPTACGLDGSDFNRTKSNVIFKPSTFFVALFTFCLVQFLVPALLLLLRIVIALSPPDQFYLLRRIFGATYAFAWRMYS
jgi:predicted DCC family thiol-disulfide oxidoreductase YuxK